METYTRCLIRHKESKRYIARNYDHVMRRMDFTTRMRSAIKFENPIEASEWLLNAPFAPADHASYEYVTIHYELTEKEVVPHVQVPGSPADPAPG